MIDHYWTVLCANSVIDSRSNNVSLQNVVEQLTIYGVPPPPTAIGGIPSPHTVVSFWGRSDWETPARGTARIIIEFQEGGDSRSTRHREVGLDLTDNKRLRTFFTLNVLPILGAGKHWVRLSLQLQDETEWSNVASVPYEIIFRPESEVPGS